ncbi:hypothetical protein ACLB2K_041850 [Fragaria x ananassa]
MFVTLPVSDEDVPTVDGSARAYRALYILNWIYRYFTEEGFVHWITWIAGIIQTLLYADFFYYYFQSWKNNVKLQLPA